MMELEPKINKGKPIEVEKIEKSELLLTDIEIKEANDLFKRKDSKENPLLGNDIARLEELTTKRNAEKEKIIPEFSFEGIAGLKDDEPAEEQHELAIKYFNNIIGLAKEHPDDFRKQALYYEKLINWDNDPKNLHSSFEKISEKKKSAFDKLTEDIFENKNSICLMKEKEWDRLRDKTDEISAEEMKIYENTIRKDRLVIMYKIPDHYIEAAIWMPSLAKEALSEVKKLYKIKGYQRISLKNSLSIRKDRVHLFDVAKEKWQNSRTAPV